MERAPDRREADEVDPRQHGGHAGLRRGDGARARRVRDAELEGRLFRPADRAAVDDLELADAADRALLSASNDWAMKPPASAKEAKPKVTTAIMSRLRRFWRNRLLQARAKALMSRPPGARSCTSRPTRWPRRGA